MGLKDYGIGIRRRWVFIMAEHRVMLCVRQGVRNESERVKGAKREVRGERGEM